MVCIYNSITNPQNGSQLHMDLLNAFATQEEADYYFAYTQTQEFKDKFGDWVKDYSVDNKTNWNIYELTGEPKLYKDTLGQYHFKASDGSKIRLDRQVLDFDHIVRKSLIDRTMFQLFGDNITSDADILEDVNIDSIFTDRSPSSIYNMVNGNMVDLQDIKYLVKQRLNMMGIKTVNDKEEAFDPEDGLDLENVENTRDIDLRASFEKNSKDNASANIKIMFNFVPEMEIVDGKYKQKQHKVTLADGQEFVYNAYYPFDKLWNMFEETLAGMTDLYNNGTVIPMFDRMVERMYDEFFDNPSITYLLSDIEALPEYKKTEFVQAFRKDKMSYVTSTITRVGDGIEYRAFDSASVTDPSKRLIKSWNADFAKTKLIKSVGDGKFTYDVSRAKAIETRYKDLVLPDIENGTKTYSENVERLINYLSSVGINVDFEIMDSYIQSYSKEGSDEDSNLLTAARNLRYIFENLAKLNTADVLNFNNTSVKNVFSNRKISGQLKRLATQAIKLRRDLSENTVMGAEGKKNWIYSAPSYIKNKIVRLKEDTASELPNNSGYYKNSRILKKFRERLNNPELNADFVKNFDLVTFLNFKEENVSDEGTDNQAIEQADQITDMMNKVLLGVLPDENSLYYTLTPADKGRMHHLKGLGMIQNVLNENGQLNEEVLDTFTGYIIDELNRIQEEFKKINNAELIKSNPELFVKDYHYKLKDNKPMFYAYAEKQTDGTTKEILTNEKSIEGKRVYPAGNAFKVILFPELSPFADRSKMDADLKAFLELIFDNKNGIISKPNDFIRNHAEMIKFLNNELALQLAIEKQNLKNIKVIREQNGVQTFPALDRRVLNTYKQVTNGDTNAAIDRAVADFTINQMIANVEYTKVFTGDPAYFKDMSDFSKRIPGTYTDGTQLVLRAGDNPNFNLAVLPNIEISSKTLEEIKAFSPKLAKAYENVNATDAQGWITLDRWKFVMERSNHWNPKFEQAYQNMLNGTPTTEDYKYAAQPVKGVHYEVVNGVPRYIKYSAAVLIPHVIKGTQLQQLNDAMIAQSIDEAVVIDGVKVGSVIPSDVVDVNGNFRKVSTNKKETLNIYAGSNENTDLSNFAIRPFTTNVETPNGEKQYTFQSVEQGFHFYKSIVANNPQVGQQILKTTNGGQLRRLTNRSNLKMSPEQVKEWDSTAKSIMLNLMYDSYIQNPNAAKKLLDTGNSIITHTQDNTRWKTDFPEVVMTVREMLSEEMNVPLESQQNLKLNSISLRNNNYKIQQDLRPKGVKLTVIGSQLKKVALTNIKFDEIYSGMTGRELVNEIMEMLSAKSDKGLQKLAKTIGIDADGNIKNKEALYSELIKSLSERGANENLITALSKEYDLDVVANYRQKTQNTIQSIINNATIKVKTNGASFIQMSSQWFDSIEDAKEAGVKLLVDDFTGLKAPHVYTDKDGKKKVRPGQVFVTSNYISKFIPNWKDLKPADLKELIDPKLLKMIGYRIPNQGMSSNDSLEIIGILPEDMGDTIVPYVDITKKTGSDFDIDKMYVMIPAAEMVKGKLKYITYDKNKPVLENSEEAIDNRIIELMQIILEDEKTYDQLMSPLDSEYLKNEIELLHGSEDNKNVGARFFTPTYQLQKKFDNSGGKSGVGLTANQLVDHMWTQTSGMKYLGNLGFGHIDTDNNTLFSEEFDILGEHRISDVLSWFLTAYVDIAKDPYVTKGNHNQYTSNTVFMLIRSGAPISFVNRLVGQPIVKELANISSLRKSRVKQPDYRKLMEAAKEDLMLAYGLTIQDIAGLKWQTAENYIDAFSKNTNKSEATAKLNNALEKDIKADVLDMSLEERRKWFSRQMSYLELWEKFHKTGEAFAQTVLASKQDVNGGGKDFVSAFINMNRVEEAGKLGFAGFNSKFKDTFLGTAYENSTELSIKIMSQLFVTANESAQELYNAVNRLMNPKHEVITNEKLAFELEKSYFSNILGQTGFNLPSNIVKGLFMGNNTVYDRVIAARNTPALKDNYFLSLLDVTMEDGIKFVKMDSTRNNSPEALNEISRSWKELLESEDAFTEQLGKDLIYYSFYNSGFRTNISSYFEHIPSDYLANMLEEGIEDAKRNYSGGIVGLNNFVDKFFRNNWNNDEIVPIVQMKPTQLKSRDGKKITINTLDAFTSTGTESDKYLKPYVKERKFDTDPVTVNLFKQVAVELNDKGKVIKSYYVRVPKLGYSKAGNNVAEWNSSTPIDGDSIIATNNLPTKVKEFMNVVQATIDYNISNGDLFSAASIMDQAEVYARLITNDRDQDSDFEKGKDDGLIGCKEGE